ncbi:hypothetical protein GLOIN_2v1843317 [Rhizophagus irregularis DAOM 181602=DAOM 197198]|nr:hypothetical protein GLOIN_2v1843317 [Rhizophagus irregularis DAOM 181602=DAOM 197198]
MLSAIKALNEEDITLYNHEVKNINEDHRIKGGRLDILEILDKKFIRSSATSRRNKDVMFLEDLLEADGINMLKWKHLCKEKGLNTKEKTPKWFIDIEGKILEDENRIIRKIKKEYIGQVVKSNIHINLFNENKKKIKNKIITWNEEGDFPIFCEDKKKSQSKKHKKIDTIKTKLKIDERGKKIYGFKTIWKIIKEKNRILEENSETFLLAKHEGNSDNEYKIILRSLVMGLLIIENNKDNKIKIAKINDYDHRITKSLGVKAREILKEENNTLEYNFEINNEALLINEFNLYWNQRLITGGYRSWRKKVTNAIWKNEMLNSNRLDDLFMYNFKKEFNWKTTLEFISNRIEFSKRQCGDKDTHERSYRIKNLLKEQLTYKVLYQ